MSDGFKVVPLWDWVMEPEPGMTWLIEGFAPTCSLVQVSGPAKIYKTFTVTLMAIAAATGEQLGRFKPSGQYRVIYWQQEGTARGNKQRFVKIVRSHLGLEWTELPADHPLRTNILWAWRQSPLLDKPGDVDKIIEVNKAFGADLNVWDSFSMMHNGEENDATAMEQSMRGLGRVRNETGSSQLYLDHTKKEDPKAKVDPDIDNDSRGSTKKRDKYDSHIGLRRPPSLGGEAIGMKVRHREHEESPWLPISWQVEDCFDNERCRSYACNHQALMSDLGYDNKPKQETKKQSLVPGVEYSLEDLASVLEVNKNEARVVKANWFAEGRARPGNGYESVVLLRSDNA